MSNSNKTSNTPLEANKAPSKEALEKQLHKIIALSDNILAKLVLDKATLEEGLGEPDKIKQTNETSQLVVWSNERDRLTRIAFSNISQNKASQSKNSGNHLHLIKNIIELDNKITKQAETNKLWLKTNILNLKKNKKAANTYKKY